MDGKGIVKAALLTQRLQLNEEERNIEHPCLWRGFQGWEVNIFPGVS